MAKGGNKQNSIAQAEHIGLDDTGDNIEAKRVAAYVWDGVSSWTRMTQPGDASAANQTNGQQLTQIVDNTGNSVAVFTLGNHALAIAPVNSAGDQINPATQETLSDVYGSVQPIVGYLTDGNQKTQIVDGSGNVIGSTSNALDVNVKSQTIPTSTLAFITTVTTAGTRVQLASNTLTNGGILQAPSTNAGIVYVGVNTVSSSVFGAELQPGQSVGWSGSNTNQIYIDSASNGDKLAFLGG